MSWTFELTDEQIKKVKEWDKCANKYHGAIGGHLTYKFSPTSIGDFVSVYCEDCKEELNLTDYDSL